MKWRTMRFDTLRKKWVFIMSSQCGQCGEVFGGPETWHLMRQGVSRFVRWSMERGTSPACAACPGGDPPTPDFPGHSCVTAWQPGPVSTVRLCRCWLGYFWPASLTLAPELSPAPARATFSLGSGSDSCGSARPGADSGALHPLVPRG